MSFSSLLDHRVSIVRQVSVLDAGDPTYDEYNQPISVGESTPDIPVAIQPKTAREMPAVSDAGVAIADYTIFMHTRDISTADAVVHDPADCPKADGADLPAARFSLIGVRNPTGRGHHLSLDAKLIDTPLSGAAGS